MAPQVFCAMLKRTDNGMFNIYDSKAFDPKKYAWNRRAHRLSTMGVVLQRMLYALMIAALVVAFIWLSGVMSNGGLGILPCLGVIAAIAVLNVCLQVSLDWLFEKRSTHLSLEERHDWKLYQYHCGNKKRIRRRSWLLVALAQLDLLRGRYDLARMALDEVDTDGFTGNQLKAYDLLWVAACAFGDHLREANTWYTRYTGIPTATPQHAAPQGMQFPPDATVQAWISGQMDEKSMQSTVRQLGGQRSTRPLLPALFGVMLSHLVFYANLWLGADNARGWYLRIPYCEIGGTLAAVFLVVLAGWVLYLAYTLHRRIAEPPSGVRRVAAVVGRIAAMAFALLLSLLMLLGVLLDSDGSERVIAANIADSTTGHTYDYLAVRRNSYDPGEATTSYYRTGDPFLMESWSAARSYDSQAADNTSEDSSGTSGEGASGIDDSGSSAGDQTQGETTTGNASAGVDGTGAEEQSTSSGGLFSSERGYSQAVQNQMQAVYLFIQGEGILTNTSFSLGSDAKGNTYATVSSGIEQKDGSDVSYEYRLYDNGEAISDGSVWEEVVLEKVYPDGGYDTELAGFYLLDPVSLEVRDEHKTAW